MTFPGCDSAKTVVILLSKRQLVPVRIINKCALL